MHGQQPQHAGFISTHLTAKADDVSEHDGGQAADLGGPRAGGVLRHRKDYQVRSLGLSNYVWMALEVCTKYGRADRGSITVQPYLTAALTCRTVRIAPRREVPSLQSRVA